MRRLSKPQLAIYEMYCFAKNAIANISGDIFFEFSTNIEDIKVAVNSIIRECDILRTRIIMQGEIPMQEKIDYEYEDFETFYFEDWSSYTEWAENQAKVPIDMFNKLYYMAVVSVGEECGVFWRMHHIIADAWSVSLLAKRFKECLLKEKIETIYNYDNYLNTEEEYLNSKKYIRDKEYWLSIYDSNNELSYLSEKQMKLNNSERKTAIVPKEKIKIIKEFCRGNNVSEYILFLAAVASYFYRVTGKEKFYLGTPILNRTSVMEKNTPGAFINTVPLLININDSTTFLKLCENIRRAVLGIFKHQKYNYSDLLKTLRTERHESELLFDVLISFQNIKLSNIKTHWYTCGTQVESLQIHVDDRGGEDVYNINYDYQVDKFSKGDIERTNNHILNLLFEGISSPNNQVCRLNIMSSDEYKTIIDEFNNTEAPYEKEKCVHNLFEELVEKIPNKTALIASDKELTYSELNDDANKIANSLIELGIKKGDIVAICLKRRSYLIASILAVLKAGAAYLPIDLECPKKRIDFMIEDSGASYTITEENINLLLSNPNKSNLSTDITSDYCCYCIYTSGSTGVPKGTLLTHRSVVNLVANNTYNKVVEEFSDLKIKSMVSITTVAFDIFVAESLLPILNEVELVLADENQSKIQASLSDLIKKYHVEVIQTTPTKLKMLINDSKESEYLKEFKIIILGGEVLDSNLISTLNSNTNAKIYNIYGPSETTVCATSARIDNAEDINIGTPVANTKIYILDKWLQPLPIGIAGEMFIAGDCVGRGYIGRDELTNERFLDNLYGTGKMYRTGDIAKWRSDGNIDYIGRNDFQVKIRGLRIELGEIESAIESIDNICQVAVVVRSNSEGKKFICAFYSGQEIEAPIIRSTISEMIPRYMIPHVFMHIKDMPMTVSGKVNRNALPEVDLENITITSKYIEPVTRLEKVLCNLVQQTLRVEKVGVNDNFFDLGGDSLSAIEFVSRAHAEKIFFELQDVFEYQTVKLLINHITSEEAYVNMYSQDDFSEINKILSTNIDDDFVPEKKKLGDILLTGATGFLGSHILADYLERESGTVYCVVRGKTINESEDYLRKQLQYYFGDKYLELIGNRIIVLCGDIEKNNLGLDEIPRINMVINAAGIVKHYGVYEEFYRINVKGTINALNLAKAAKAKFIQISTISVSGNAGKEMVTKSIDNEFDSRSNMNEDNISNDNINNYEEIYFSEKNLFINQNLSNMYIRSKFEAEKYVLDEMVKGLEANIIRVGNLTNRVSDLRFQPNYHNNAFLKRLKGILDLGMFPEYLKSFVCEFSPVDDTAKAILNVAEHFNNNHTVFNLNNGKVLAIKKLFEYLEELGINIKIVDEKLFSSEIEEVSKDKQRQYIYHALINDIDDKGRLVFFNNIHIQNATTIKYLDKIGFNWSNIDQRYIVEYINWFREVGLITV